MEPEGKKHGVACSLAKGYVSFNQWMEKVAPKVAVVVLSIVFVAAIIVLMGVAMEKPKESLTTLAIIILGGSGVIGLIVVLAKLDSWANKKARDC